MNQYAVTIKSLRFEISTVAITAESEDAARKIALSTMRIAGIVSVTLIPAAWQVK